MCFMKTGEKTWFPKAFRCFACWISRVATSLCLRASLTVCPLDRLALSPPTYSCWSLGALPELLPLVHTCPVVLFTGILGPWRYRCGVCRLAA